MSEETDGLLEGFVSTAAVIERLNRIADDLEKNPGFDATPDYYTGIQMLRFGLLEELGQSDESETDS